MHHHLSELDNWFYAVFERSKTHPADRGVHVGSVSLRRAPRGPELPPPTTFAAAAEVGSANSEAHEPVGLEALEIRVLGYALFAHAQGKGYATEAVGGLLNAYRQEIGKWGESKQGLGKGDVEEKRFYVEAGVDQENPGSQRVLRKLGFRTVGMKIEKEKAWLNGAWRGPEWWITGLYL